LVDVRVFAMVDWWAVRLVDRLVGMWAVRWVVDWGWPQAGHWVRRLVETLEYMTENLQVATMVELKVGKTAASKAWRLVVLMAEHLAGRLVALKVDW
jgi:hypothetical protein